MHDSFDLRAVLFDCDGVIADSEASWNDIDAAFLARYGVEGYKGEYKQHVLGKSFALSIGFYTERFGIEAPLDELLAARTEVAAHFYATQIPLFPGVLETLEQTRELGLKTALATSSVGALIGPFLERHGLTELFDVLITGEMVVNGKPHPDIYELAARRVETPTAKCLVVEDALAGLQAGRAAGCKTVAIPDERWFDLRDFEGKSDYTLEKTADLPTLLENLKSQQPA